MAERRMFAKTIVLSDDFLDMPLSTRCLYFTLGMFADDDGFVNSPKGIMRQCGATEDDMKLLLAKSFVLSSDSGVIVIKHWRINNYLRNDRHQATKYIDEMSQLEIKDNGAYSFGIPNSGIPSIDKNSIGKNSIGKCINGAQKFAPPTTEEVKQYALDNGINIDAQRFVDFYQSKGWMIGKNKMEDWQAAVRTWRENPKQKQPNINRASNYDELEKKLIGGGI